MILEKYKNLLIQKIKEQISEWFELQSDTTIPNADVYRFLHSIKGTAGTIELGGLHQLADRLMDNIQEADQKEWDRKHLQDYLYELISLTYEYEHFYVQKEQVAASRLEDAPLIQIIDDDISMLILLKDLLEEKGWMVIAQSDPQKAINQYFEFRPDCLILDVHLVGSNGFQILDDLQKHNQKQFVPKIMMSAATDRNTRIKAYRSGADDFIEKPLDLEELTVRLERLLDRKQIFDQSVLMDELTKVYNRRFLNDVLERNLNDWTRTGIPFTIAMLDLDYFKKINDRYGHLVGDKVLSSFASFLKEETRSSDTVFRFGGEEFTVLFPKTSEPEAKEILTRLLSRFSEIVFKEKEEFKVTFSAGVFEVNAAAITAELALQGADQALYKAKQNGRARIEMAGKDVAKAVKRTLYVSAIDDDVIIRTMLMKVLQSLEFQNVTLDIQVFENGMKFFDSGRFDMNGEHFLILDGVMPVMDGLEVLRKVKSLKRENQIYVLMLTGRKGDEDITRALKLGADDYVTKPFSLMELQARIQRLIQRMK